MDPWSKLVRRAQAYRHELLHSGDASASCSTSGKLVTKSAEQNNKSFQGSLLRELLSPENTNLAVEEEEEEEEEEFFVANSCTDFEQKLPRDVAEEALLEELFFPANTKSPFSSSLMELKDESLDRNNVYLTVHVGKLFLCHSIKNTPAGMIEDVRVDKRVSSCSLTLIFPNITEEGIGLGSSQEQRISIMPTNDNGNEFVFDHLSQLRWKLPLTQSLSSIWDAQQVMKASIELSFRGGDVLHGNAYLPLQNMVEQKNYHLQLKMVLVGCATSLSGNSQVPSNCQLEKKTFARRQLKNCIPTIVDKDNQEPLAILEIGLKLVHSGAYDSNSMSLPHNVASASKETWLYVYVHGGASKLKGDPLYRRSKFMMLIIKVGNQSMIRLLSRGNSTSRSTAWWQVLEGNFADALLMMPDRTRKPTVFIEVWYGHMGLSKARRNGLGNLIGLAKVPIRAVNDEHKSQERSIVDGLFLLWHPRNNAEGKKIRVTIYSGLNSRMLRVLKETRSAVIIQRYFRAFLARLHKQKLRQKEEGSIGILSQAFKLCIFKIGLCLCLNLLLIFAGKGETLRHVFEVTVQRAKLMPVDKLSNNDDGYYCRTVFIKYIFPGEDEPLYTNDVELQQTVVFGATAHHRISLVDNQSLADYLEELDEDTNGLRFELWSDIWDNQKSTNCTIPSDHGSRNCRTVLKDDSMYFQETEKYIGFATLSIQDLLGLLALNTQDHTSLKIRRLFSLPIKLQKWVGYQEYIPHLIVQVAYDVVELVESSLLDGTVFHNHPNFSCFPLKSTLEVMVLGMKLDQANQNLCMSSLSDMKMLCIRFSLFPCNRELESKYPPLMSYVDEVNYQFKSTLQIILDVILMRELWESYMTFEVWEQRTNNEESLSLSAKECTWLGVAIAPCVMLISQKQGISGWIDLMGLQKVCIGYLEVSVKFSAW